MVVLGDGGGEDLVGGHHDQGHVSLGSTSDHVLDEVAVTCIDDGVVALH